VSASAGHAVGGQKQRIAIARRFSPARDLGADEALGLDAESEREVQKGSTAARGPDHHRDRTPADTIFKADRILVFDKGRIAESGTHDQL